MAEALIQANFISIPFDKEVWKEELSRMLGCHYCF